jgi:hypothetical protein
MQSERRRTSRVQRIAKDSTRALEANAARMARLLRLLEVECYGDARCCPFCHADDDAPAPRGLPHAPDCELDDTLRAVSLSSEAAITT